jgi:SAM-dependent methyltransferase
MTYIDGDRAISPNVSALWDMFYPKFDGEDFMRALRDKLQSESKVLEIGAGSGQGLQKHFDIRHHVGRYYGIDLDPRVLKNPYLDEAVCGDARDLPFPDESMDLIFHVSVAEHLVDPITVLQESFRVLKKGGTLMFQTPNRYYYAMIAARFTSYSFHEWFGRHLGAGRQPEDIFPTVYKLNTARAIAMAANLVGFRSQVRFIRSPPGYLRFSTLAFLFGVAYERTVERWFPQLSAVIVAELTKPA